MPMLLVRAFLAPFFFPWFRTRCAALALLLTTALGACGGGAAEAKVSQPRSALPACGAGPVCQFHAGQTACDSASGRVLDVGPGKAYAAPSAAAAVARAGDVVRIAAGDYRGDVAIWSASHLTICGIGGRARLFADGRSAAGKAIWVVSGANTTIDSIAFHNAVVPDKNGAGIRAEHRSGDLRIVNSGFYDNENGILTAAGPVSLTIERSEFARSVVAGGLGHNLYVGRIDRLTVTGSHFHEATVGHNLKSRALESLIENSYFMDGPNGRSSYLADFSNGGRVTLRGNLMQKGPKAENRTAIAYGAEGLASGATHTLTLSHNTVVLTRPNSTFIRVPSATSSVRLVANLLASPDNAELLSGGFALTSVVQQDNFRTTANQFPLADRVDAPGFWPLLGLIASLPLAAPTDPAFLRDSPQPHALRTLAGSARWVGALQSAP